MDEKIIFSFLLKITIFYFSTLDISYFDWNNRYFTEKNNFCSRKKDERFWFQKILLVLNKIIIFIKITCRRTHRCRYLISHSVILIILFIKNITETMNYGTIKIKKNNIANTNSTDGQMISKWKFTNLEKINMLI